jgi:hypothetical protein
MHLAIKECQIASKYLTIHDRQIAIAHLTMKVRQIAINFFSKTECHMPSNYLAMLVMFAHLAIKERQIASNFFSKRECQVTNVCLTKQIIQIENILFMFYHIHGTFKLLNILLMFHHIHVTFKFWEFNAAASNYISIFVISWWKRLGQWLRQLTKKTPKRHQIVQQCKWNSCILVELANKECEENFSNLEQMQAYMKEQVTRQEKEPGNESSEEEEDDCN